MQKNTLPRAMRHDEMFAAPISSSLQIYPPELGRCLPRQSPHYGGYTKCLAVRLRQCDQTNIVFTPMHYNVPSLLCQTRGSRTAAQVSAESAFQRSYSIIYSTFLFHHIYSISALYVQKKDLEWWRDY